MYIDGDGDWVDAQRGVTFTSPTVHVLPYRDIRAQVEEQWYFTSCPREGDAVVDVGAGIGEGVIVLSRQVGPKGRVLAIEAHPRTFRCLEKNIKRNRLANVTAVHVAASDCDGELGMTDRLDHHIGNRVVEHGGAIRIKARRLGAILLEHGFVTPSIVKINIEGAETKALAGMAELLPDVRQLVVACHDFLADEGGSEELRTRADVARLLAASGFDVTLRDGDPRPWMRDHVYADRGRSPDR